MVNEKKKKNVINKYNRADVVLRMGWDAKPKVNLKNVKNNRLRKCICFDFISFKTNG